METKPTIYILAGANGIGKTSINPFFIPKGVTYINADDIARQLRERLGSVNVQELANAEAIDRMNGFIAKRQNFPVKKVTFENALNVTLMKVKVPVKTIAEVFASLTTPPPEICDGLVWKSVGPVNSTNAPTETKSREVGLKEEFPLNK